MARAKILVGDKPLERLQVLQDLKGVEGLITITGVVKAPGVGGIKKIK